MERIPEYAVFMEKISSREHFLRKQNGEMIRRVLEDISLLIRKGESWGFIGPSLYEMKLLLEIIANIKHYESGRCVLVEQGMPKHKRIILKHLFYIGNTEMMYNNMNVLEFLMFAAAKFKVSKVELQEQIFEWIIEIGLGHLSLSPIQLLTREEKAVVILVAAALSASQIIVFNLPELEFDPVLSTALARISGFVREMEKTLILASVNCDLLEKSCTHLGIIRNGKIIYHGTVKEFRLKYDHIAVIIRDKNIGQMQEKLSALFPRHHLSLKNSRIFLSSDCAEENDPGLIYRKIIGAGLTPEQMEVNPKTVQNAYEELMRQYDLRQ